MAYIDPVSISIDEDMQLIYVEVFPKLMSNFSCIDLHVASKNMTKDLIKHLEKHGLTSIKEYPMHPMAGGPGVPDNLLSMIKNIWEHREIYVSIISLLKMIKSTNKQYLMYKIMIKKPIVNIKFGIKSKFTYKEIIDCFGVGSFEQKLQQIVTLADDARMYLTENYSLFCFTEGYLIETQDSLTVLNVNCTDPTRTIFKESRIKRIYNKNKLKSGFYISYDVKRFTSKKFIKKQTRSKEGYVI